MRKPKSAPNGRTVIQDQWKKRPGIRAGLEDLVVSQFVRTFEGALFLNTGQSASTMDICDLAPKNCGSGPHPPGTG